MDKLRQYMYYCIIAIISFIALAFIPMIGSDLNIGWNLPNTSVGWIIWVSTKLIVATINVLIFHCFMCQAKINIKNNENYIKAKDILFTQKVKIKAPRSPRKWNAEQYGKKATTIFATSSLSAVALTQAILSYNYMEMLVFLFVIVMGLIFGVMQMKKAEEYWTNEFLDYAIKYQREQEMLEEAQKETSDETKGEKENDNNA